MTSPIIEPLLSGLDALWDYVAAHTIFCLVPALFIAGAIGALLKKEAVLKYFGADVKPWLSYTIASISGTVLAVCSCTILPLFGGIHKKGAEVNPLRGVFAVTIAGKPAVVEYEPDSDLRDTEQIPLLEELAETVSQTALCALGKTAPNPVLSTLRYFREEYEAHIDAKRCPAHVCKVLIEYAVDAARCTGCGACARACPYGAVSGEKKKVHVIDPNTCRKCGICSGSCAFAAITVN